MQWPDFQIVYRSSGCCNEQLLLLSVVQNLVKHLSLMRVGNKSTHVSCMESVMEVTTPLQQNVGKAFQTVGYHL
jgi:hypothetical protein